MKNFIVIFFVTGIAALSLSFKVFDKRHVSKNMLHFIESKKYTYSEWKKDIPESVMKGIKKFEKGQFNPGDLGDSGKIAMGCVVDPDAKFDGKLNFVMTNDSLCLLSYTHGGFIVSNTVYFIRYKPVFTLAKFQNLQHWPDTDVESVTQALKKHPKADDIWTCKEKN